MKRSEVNAIIRDADAFLKRQNFLLPPFAHWGPEAWAAKGPEVREIVERRLGWDITDFGQGDFARIGLAVFTIRNGAPENLKTGQGKVYAEKILIVDPGQVTPVHFHWVKTEDIINRGGGRLAVKLYNATTDNKLADTDVTVTLDGVQRTLKAGETIELMPGESITLVPYCAHEFWGVGSRALVGEVSTVNDDNTDNCFVGGVGRFPAIEEDEPPLFLLVNDYDRFYSA
jgi:D-lyxose ketol-isomerase